MVGRPSRKIPCGAARKYDGQPCQAKALANGRCYLHGGLSTGQKTIEGKVKALKNLRQYKSWSDEELRQLCERRYFSKPDDGYDINKDL